MATATGTRERSIADIDEAVGSVARLSDSEVAQRLAETLGMKLTAALGKVTETRRVRDWISGAKPSRRAHGLRVALQAAVAIATAYDAHAARAWFLSTNPALGMRSPLAFVRNASDVDDYDRLVKVAVDGL